MSREIIIKAFAVALDLPAGTDIEALELGVNPQWDSIGHMALVAELEERFGIALDTEDLIAMNTFAASIEILKRYGVAL